MNSFRTSSLYVCVVLGIVLYSSCYNIDHWTCLCWNFLESDWYSIV